MPYFKKGLFMKYPASYSPSFAGLKTKKLLTRGLKLANFSHLGFSRQELCRRGVQLEKNQQTVFTIISFVD